MKRMILVVIFLLFVANAVCDEVKGDTLTYDGKKVLRVWGTHYERGYAYGYLMADQIVELAFDYFLGSYFYNNPAIYNTMANYVTSYFVIEDKYQQEFDGMIAGMTDAGVNLYSTVLGRDFGTEDLLLCNSITDLAGFLASYGIDTIGCSSMSSWGNSTLYDPQLLGDIVISRNMDWSSNAVLQSNHLMLISFPEEEDEQPWLSMCFSGMIGALSGVNINGTCAFMNVGNICTADNPGNLHPIFLSIRNGLEMLDYNQDGESNNYDVYSSIDNSIHYGASIVHSVTNPEAIIIEVNNENGTTLRTVSDNFEVSGDNLVATNHFRNLYDPVYCYRYQAFVNALESSDTVTLQDSWDITTDAGGVANNLHTMQYAPSLNRLLWSTTYGGIPAYLRNPTVFDLTQWFEQPVDAQFDDLPGAKSKLKIYPNPATSLITVNCQDDRSVNSGLLEVFNVKGQKILSKGVDRSFDMNWDFLDENGNDVTPGIYLLRFVDGNDKTLQGKVVKLR